MSLDSFTITLTGLSDREREQAASDLARVVAASHQSVQVERQQENSSAMDFGGTLVLIIGSGAAVAVARGIEAWLRRRQDASITIEDKQRKIKATGITSADAIRISEAFNISSQRE
jgi:hypothetical protein